MCGQDKEGGYKCTVCSYSFYCNDCRKLHLDARIEDGDGESAIDGDLNDTMSVTQSQMNLALEQGEDILFLGEPHTEMRQEVKDQLQFQQDQSDTQSEKVLFGGAGLIQQKKRDSKKKAGAKDDTIS